MVVRCYVISQVAPFSVMDAAWLRRCVTKCRGLCHAGWAAHSPRRVVHRLESDCPQTTVSSRIAAMVLHGWRFSFRDVATIPHMRLDKDREEGRLVVAYYRG